ncbi:MAG: hypothetical protein KatS3mg105_0196 [Gemmatales bacterium]|nr:MAG: hypothetical protein KatS3mg105_0196 [Gemmatales bacterium]
MSLIRFVSRRHFLATAGAAVGTACFSRAEPRMTNIAAIITEYRRNSHADVIAGRWLEGFDLDGKSAKPKSKLVSMYTDQLPPNDMSRSLARKHGFTIYKSIREALCCGGDKLAVDGVLLIGEHGNYPVNEKGQKLYPRRRLFEGIVDVFRASKRSVPVFNDKHLSYSWENTKWMYDRAIEMKIPLMAGSSLPTTWRLPPLELPGGVEVEEAVVTSYGGLESYGFHALEALQCVLERRKGNETGVQAVTCLEGDQVWNSAKKLWSPALLDAALAKGMAVRKGTPRDNCKKPAAFVIEYRDGCRATLLHLSGHVREMIVAARIKGEKQPFAVNFWLQDGRPYGHFTMLCQGIDAMFMTGKPTWPVERTLLTTGILDAALTSRFKGHVRLQTPHLAISYQPGPAWKQPPPPRVGPALPK